MSNTHSKLALTMEMENISIYIPHVYKNYTKEKITHIFEEKLQIGMVRHIDCVAKMNDDGKLYNSVYIYFENWFTNEKNQQLQQELSETKAIKLIYDAPWYWLVLKNKTNIRPVINDRKKKIVLDIPVSKPQDQEQDLTKIQDVIYKEQENWDLYEEYPKSTMEEMQEVNAGQNIYDFIQSIENELEEDERLITIDSRYVEQLELDNQNSQEYITLLQNQMLQMQNNIMYVYV